MRTVAAIFLTLAGVALVTGCGATSQNGGAAATATVVDFTETAIATGRGSVDQIPEQVHGIDVGAGVALLDQAATRKEIIGLYDNFGRGSPLGATSWFGDIQAVGVSGYDGKATVQTNLYRDADATTVASHICAAAIGAGAVGGRITDATGETLAECP